MPLKLLITGTRGFVGRNLAEYFSARPDMYSVTPLSRQQADLLDERAVREHVRMAAPDVVIHCAKIGGTRKTGYDAGATDVSAANLRMFMNLARCLPPGARLLNMGSGAEYDNRAYLPKMSEDYFDVNVPTDAYGFSKYVISKHISRAEQMVCLRIFGLFGRNEDYTFKFISNSIVRNLLGLPITINQNARFDYLYMDDFSRMVERFLSVVPKFRHYNATPSESIDLVSLARLVNSVSGKVSEIRVLNPGMNPEYTGDNSRFMAEFPDFSFTSAAKAIKELYDYYAANLDELDVASVKADPYLKNCRTMKK